MPNNNVNTIHEVIAGRLSAVCRTTKLLALVGGAPASVPLIAEAAKRVICPGHEEKENKLDTLAAELEMLKQISPETFEKMVEILKKRPA